MCIRDSHYTAESRSQLELVSRCADELDRQVELLLRVTSGNQFGMSEADVTAVSYTHLDVYKRQTVSSAVLVGLMKEKLPGVRLIGWHHNSYEIYFQTPVHGFLIQRKLSAIALRKLDALITVSYTHLDVYKRQVSGGLCRICTGAERDAGSDRDYSDR